jgi:N-acetylmuramoyl-L-alanine amidase
MSLRPPITRRLFLGQGVSCAFLAPELLRINSARGAPLASPGVAPIPARPAIPGRQSPLVMLDPGHGGKDPGAIGLSGTYEKHIALATAQELKRRLEATGRYRVEMTRARDVFIPLDSRVVHAQGRGAALFVSLHADALSDHLVRGASVYTLSTTASDAQTAALARRENSADRYAGPQFRNMAPEIAQILASLVRQETRLGSARMARSLVRQLGQDLPMLPNPARHAAFVVLKAADVPSVLVEMGFMSNPEDEKALRRTPHRTKVAISIARAVDAYFAAVGHVTRMAG